MLLRFLSVILLVASGLNFGLFNYSKGDVRPDLEKQVKVNPLLVNKTDSLVRKQGFWVENDSTHFCYYKDGVKDGPYYEMNKYYKRVTITGAYCEGVRCGVWAYYNEKIDRLGYTEQNYTFYKEKEVKTNIGTFYTNTSCLYTEYNEDGTIKLRGKMLLNSEAFEEDGYCIGNWEVYGKMNKLIKKVRFDKPTDVGTLYAIKE